MARSGVDQKLKWTMTVDVHRNDDCAAVVYADGDARGIGERWSRGDDGEEEEDEKASHADTLARGGRSGREGLLKIG